MSDFWAKNEMSTDPKSLNLIITVEELIMSFIHDMTSGSSFNDFRTYALTAM